MMTEKCFTLKSKEKKIKPPLAMLKLKLIPGRPPNYVNIQFSRSGYKNTTLLTLCNFHCRVSRIKCANVDIIYYVVNWVTERKISLNFYCCKIFYFEFSKFQLVYIFGEKRVICIKFRKKYLDLFL